MPRLEDSLQITINDPPEPEITAGGSDMPSQTIEAGGFVEKFMDDEIPLEDSLPTTDEPTFVMKPPPQDKDLFEVPEPQPQTNLPLTRRELELANCRVEEIQRTPTGKVKKAHGVNKNGKKRKPMSEEHKAKLAVAREKALAKRRANAQKRKEEREKLNPPDPAGEAPSISLHGIPTEPVKERPPSPKVPAKKTDSITREDLEEISLKTVIALETMRKQRKAEKKKKQAEDKYKDEVMQTIKHAKPSWITDAGQYADCF